MDVFNGLLRPSWGSERWILEGWNQLSQDEKQSVTHRMDDLFKDGLPFELQHDKLLYIYVFSFLAQLEVLAIQVPLRFEEKMSSPAFKQQMRAQLLDEVFHGMVFTKIVYLLCVPYGFPPAYNAHIEALCDFIRQEECSKVGLVLLNLVTEGWIEEVFKSLYQKNIAPKVFQAILADEHRHVCEADLYCSVGLPSREILSEKLHKLEQLFLTALVLEPKYTMALSELLGERERLFIAALNAKHVQQLAKIGLKPTRQWQFMMPMLLRFGQSVFGKSLQEGLPSEIYEVEMTPLRQFLMTQWDAPTDPTMVSQFNIDVNALDFFAKKYAPETLTTLMLQAVSHVLTRDDSFRNFLSYNKLRQTRGAKVAIVVKLPGCHDQLGYIIYRNCHEMSLAQLSSQIRHTVQKMVYCYKKREEVEKKHPYLKEALSNKLYEYAHDEYPYPMPGCSFVSVSNIGLGGYSQAVSPLRKQESLKVTLLMVEKKPVWNHKTQSFEAKDILPVSVSADHRVFDGSLPIPHYLDASFQQMFKKMLEDNVNALETPSLSRAFYASIDNMLAEHLEFGHRVLSVLQSLWSEETDVIQMFQELMATARKVSFS